MHLWLCAASAWRCNHLTRDKNLDVGRSAHRFPSCVSGRPTVDARDGALSPTLPPGVGFCTARNRRKIHKTLGRDTGDLQSRHVHHGAPPRRAPHAGPTHHAHMPAHVSRLARGSSHLCARALGVCGAVTRIVGGAPLATPPPPCSVGSSSLPCATRASTHPTLRPASPAPRPRLPCTSALLTAFGSAPRVSVSERDRVSSAVTAYASPWRASPWRASPCLLRWRQQPAAISAVPFGDDGLTRLHHLE